MSIFSGSSEIEYEEYDWYGSKPYCPDLHLQVAIRPHSRALLASYLQDKDIACTKDIVAIGDILLSHSYTKDKSLFFDTEKQYGKLLMPHLSCQRDEKIYRRVINENLTVAGESAAQAAQLFGISLSNEMLARLKTFQFSQELLGMFMYRSFWDGVRDMMKDKQILKRPTLLEINNSDVDITGFCSSYFLFLTSQTKIYVFDYEQVLMLADTVNSRYLTMFYLSLSDRLDLDYNPKLSLLKDVYQWGDRLLTKYGNTAYSIIKNLEPITIGTFLDKHDPLPLSGQFLARLLAGETNEEYRSHLSELVNILKRSCTHENHYMEIFGVYRHFGHPTVDEEGGMESMFINTTMSLPMDESALQEVSGAFKRSFILEFVNINRRWPKCSISGTNPNSFLKKLVITKPLAFSEYDKKISLTDWHSIQFDQEFAFDDFLDFTQLLADKALSPYLQNWYAAYSTDLLNVRKNPRIKESRRLLVEILSRVDMSCAEIRQIVQSRKIPWYWYVVALHSKERELKIKARLFSMLCLEIRLYFSVTEKNLADQLFKYIPNQSMTMTEAELIKKLIELSSKTVPVDLSSGKQATKLSVVISLDFEKFNQRWRDRSTRYIFTAFDQLFGTPGLYTFSHEFFENSYFYLSSFLNPPDFLRKHRRTDKKSSAFMTLKNATEFLKGSRTSWLHQDGGCEGLRQKGWTVIIQSALEVVRYKTGVRSFIIGQGDNQIIVVELPIPYENMAPSEYLTHHNIEIEQALGGYMKELKTTTMGIGMDLKLEESWISVRLINYGKELIVDGSMMGGGLKRAGRTYQEVNEIHPTIQNRIAAIFTSAQSVGQKTYDNLIPYFLSMTESMCLVSKETKCGTICGRSLQMLFTQFHLKCDIDFKRFLAIFPLEVGGLPIPPFTSLVYRGHPDPLVNILYWLKISQGSNPFATPILQMIVGGYLDSETTDFTYLIMDPQSVNFKKPVRSSNQVKKILEGTVRRVNKNKHIGTMLNQFDQSKMAELVNYLMTVEPVTPRVFNEILRLSPVGCMLSFFGMFTDMRTMKQMISVSEANHLVETLKKSDLDLFMHLANVYRAITKKLYLMPLYQKLKVHGYDRLREHISKELACTYKASEKIRNRTWGVEVREVSMPTPFEQFTLYRLTNGECPHQNCKATPFISYVFQKEAAIRTMSGTRFQRGFSRPYQGSGTSEKRSGPTLIYPKSEKPLRAAQNLYRLGTWVCDPRPDNTLKAQIDKIRVSRCDASELIIVATGGICFGGCRTHRLSNATTKHECRPAIRINIHSRIQISSDQLGFFSLAKENYPLLFQAIFLAALNTINHQELFREVSLTDENLVYHQHISCLDCLKPIIEEPLYTKVPSLDIVVLKDCPLLFSSVDENLTNIPLSSFERTEMVVPNYTSKKYMRDVCNALSFLLVGEIHTLVTPIIRSPSNFVNKIGTYAGLTIGLFKLVDLSMMLKHISVIFLCDFLPEIIHRSKRYYCSMAMSCKMILNNLPESSWEILKPYLCSPEVFSKLSQLKLLTGTSSEMFITGRGLGSAINRRIHRIISDWEASQWRSLPKIPFYTTAPGISIQRTLFIWVNYNLLLSGWSGLTHLASILGKSREIVQSCISKGSVNIQRLILGVANIQSHPASFHRVLGSRRFILSKIGCEPWLAPGPLLCHLELSGQRVQSVINLDTHPLPCDERIKIMALFREIGLLYNVALHEPLVLNTDSDNSIYQPVKRGHRRLEHVFRLVGRYSTAPLKYLNVLSTTNLVETRGCCNLAEGAGGLSGMGIRIFGAKLVIYNSLFSGRQLVDHRARFFKPAELNDLPNVTLLGPEECYETGGDLTSPLVVAIYRRLVCERKDKIQLVTLDAETPIENQNLPLLLCHSLVTILTDAAVDTRIVFKTFCGNEITFNKVVGLFAKNFTEVRINVSRFSAADNTEVFLTAKRGMSSPVGGEWTLLMRDLTIVQDLSRHRVSNTLLISPSHYTLLREVYLRLHDAGIRLNIFSSLHIFSGYVQDETSFRENILRAVADTHSVVMDTLHTRFSLMCKLQKGEWIHTTMRHNLKLQFSDHREIRRLLMIHVNMDFLLQFLKTRIPDVSLFDKQWGLFDATGRFLFSYKVSFDRDLWTKLYQKSFYKILGHYRIINNWSFSIPMEVFPPIGASRS